MFSPVDWEPHDVFPGIILGCAASATDECSRCRGGAAISEEKPPAVVSQQPAAFEVNTRVQRNPPAKDSQRWRPFVAMRVPLVLTRGRAELVREAAIGCLPALPIMTGCFIVALPLL